MAFDQVGAAHFKKVRDPADNAARNVDLDLSNQQAFLALKDAQGKRKPSEAIAQRYEREGFEDHNNVRRVVRAVSIPAGTRIYKLTGGLEAFEPQGPVLDPGRAVRLMKDEVLFKFPIMSPWWAPVTSFEEDAGALKGHFEDMVFNATAMIGPGTLTLREYGRFMSAVVLEWNKLNYMVELTLSRAVPAYWGQFEEQVGTASLAAFSAAGGGAAGWGWTAQESVRVVEEGGGKFIVYKGEEDKRYYLPDWLGGLEAWQFYIPKFQRTDIDENSVKVIPCRDTNALAAHLGCPDVFERARTASTQIQQNKARRGS